MRDITITYIGGGSVGWARTLMTDLKLDKSLSGIVKLYDLSIERARANAIIGNRLMASDNRWRFEVSDTLKEALTGADFVLISIMPGGFDEMEVDVHMPERLGVYQSVGDTAGPGGIIRGLRAVPMFVTLAEAVREYCPEAFVINYTNPMALLVKTLYHVFPGIRAFGCCHEVFNTEELLAYMAMERFKAEGISREDIYVNVKGINHFTWFDEASWQGTDLMPVYREFAREHIASGYTSPGKYWEDGTFYCAHRVKMDLFLRYGLIAAAGDRHLAEFMPGDMYLRDPDTVEKWKFKLTPVSWRREDKKEKLEKTRRILNGEEELAIEPTGEEGIRIIRALLGMERLITNVNLPNTLLQIPNLPREAVVETNAVFTLGHIRPVMAGSLPEPVRELILPHIASHELTLKAALSGKREPVYEAFYNDPLLKGRAGESELRKLADDMMDMTLKGDRR